MISKSIAGGCRTSSSGKEKRGIVKKNNRLFLLLLLIVFVYIFAGAGIFVAIERPNEELKRLKHQSFYKDFLRNNTCVTREEMIPFLEHIVELTKAGIVDFSENHTQQWNWDYPSALGFVATTITTIGYGNVAPSTILGQAVCMLYSLIGIPLVYWLLATIVELESCYFGLAERRLHRHVTRLFGAAFCTPHRQKAISTAVTVVLCYILLILLPSIVLTRTEGWSVFEAHYFTIITLTTIGFGDYVPANQPQLNFMTRLVYKILIVLYLLLGLAFLGVLINSCMEFQKKRVTKMKKALQKYNTVIRGRHFNISGRLIDSDSRRSGKAEDSEDSRGESSHSGVDQADEMQVKLTMSKDSNSNGYYPKLIHYSKKKKDDQTEKTTENKSEEDIKSDTKSETNSEKTIENKSEEEIIPPDIESEINSENSVKNTEYRD